MGINVEIVARLWNVRGALGKAKENGTRAAKASRKGKKEKLGSIFDMHSKRDSSAVTTDRYRKARDWKQHH